MQPRCRNNDLTFGLITITPTPNMAYAAKPDPDAHGISSSSKKTPQFFSLRRSLYCHTEEPFKQEANGLYQDHHSEKTLLIMKAT